MMKKDRTILQLLIPFAVLVSLMLFAACHSCQGQTIRTDYKDHFLVGTMAGMTGAVIDVKREKPVLSAAVTGLSIAIYKEVIYDFAMDKGTFEVADILFTTAGAVATGLMVKGFIKLGDRLSLRYGDTRPPSFNASYRPPTDKKPGY